MVEELRGLRRLLDALEKGKMTMRMGGQDVTEREMELMRREIAHDEAILMRSQERGANVRKWNACQQQGAPSLMPKVPVKHNSEKGG